MAMQFLQFFFFFFQLVPKKHKNIVAKNCHVLNGFYLVNKNLWALGLFKWVNNRRSLFYKGRKKKKVVTKF